MGIIYKILKHRVEKSEEENFQQQQQQHQQQDLQQQQHHVMDLTMRSKINKNDDFYVVDEDMKSHQVDDRKLLLPTLETDDKQFTAEHILQLCRFLAEKSKKNKSPQKHLNPPRKRRFSGHASTRNSQEEAEIRNLKFNEKNSSNYDNSQYFDYNPAEESRNYGTINKSTEQTTNTLKLGNILLSNSNNNSNSNNSSSNITKFHHQHVNGIQSQRDFLLSKIRNQIFERERQKRLAREQADTDVWRPW